MQPDVVVSLAPTAGAIRGIRMTEFESGLTLSDGVGEISST